MVERIDQHSSQLAEALKSGTAVIITTLQKFPFVTEKIGQLRDRRYALIVDEAHSSQSGESARQMTEVLAARSLEDAEEQEGATEDDAEDRLVEVMRSRGKQKNLSFFAFTATPKAKTLEVFGRHDEEGRPRPFHQDLPDTDYTEVGMNQGIKERALPEKFASDDYRILLVANKYQTGFDQPLLHTMYVDKRLAGVQAVQTLSRLNRTCRGKEDTFVLDFVNTADDSEASFQPYYEQSTVAESADPHQLYELQSKLDAAQIYTNTEVENLCKIWYAPKASQSAKDQAELYRYLQPAVDRFNAADEDAQEEFRGWLRPGTRYSRLPPSASNRSQCASTTSA